MKIILLEKIKIVPENQGIVKSLSMLAAVLHCQCYSDDRTRLKSRIFPPNLGGTAFYARMGGKISFPAGH